MAFMMQCMRLEMALFSRPSDMELTTGMGPSAEVDLIFLKRPPLFLSIFPACQGGWGLI